MFVDICCMLISCFIFQPIEVREGVPEKAKKIDSLGLYAGKADSVCSTSFYLRLDKYQPYICSNKLNLEMLIAMMDLRDN